MTVNNIKQWGVLLLLLISIHNISSQTIVTTVSIIGENADDQSGRAVSLSADGNTIAIGARLNNGNGSNSGHTRIYEWINSSWTQKGLDIDGENVG